VSGYADFDPAQIKHLEMLQVVIARLANEAALVRGWALTVAAAFFGFAAKSLSWRIAAVGMLPVVAFWWLNAYYLRAEQQYRGLYDRVRRGDNTVEPFSMFARNEPAASRLRVMWSLTLRPLYLMMVGVGVVLIIAGLIKN
jgi:hypothetical protein